MRGSPKPFSPGSMVRRFVPIGRNPIQPRRWLPGPRFATGRFRNRHLHSPSLGRLGSMEVRLARTGGEVKRAQQVRYHVFYEEKSAIPDAYTLATRRDRDAFDPVCDHMLVLDHEVRRKGFRRRRPQIVGTYRLLRQEIAERYDGFYTAGEYDIAPLLERHRGKKFLELGRSCVLRQYRTKRTVELLWRGVWTYILRYNMDVMIGCASLDGTDVDAHANELAFLHHFCLAPPEWRARALPSRFTEMNRMPADEVDQKSALRRLPPLIKGYLRLGGFVGEGAVVDHQFGTTDVFIMVPRAAISTRYINYYGAEATRHSL